MSRYTITVTSDGRSDPDASSAPIRGCVPASCKSSPTRPATISLSPHRSRLTSEWNH